MIFFLFTKVPVVNNKFSYKGDSTESHHIRLDHPGGNHLFDPGDLSWKIVNESQL